MRIPFIAGNWKMNTTVHEAEELVHNMLERLDRIEGVEKVLCPPFISLPIISELLTGSSIKLGAQNMHFEIKGAYTGAHKASPGLLEEAHGGTLFLDEIGDLSLENQARILRVVENATFRRLGGKREIRVDIRFLAATNHDLHAAVRAERFRTDLFHRINAIEVTLPALRDHREDIPELAEHFFRMFKNQAMHPLAGMDPAAMDFLQAHPWRGNVRELRNVIHRAVTLARRETVGLADVADTGAEQARTGAPELTLSALERAHIAAIFRQCGGNIQQAAAILGIARSTLYKKLAEYGITME